MREHLCSACGNVAMQRSARKGKAETYFWPLLGFFPWRCHRCTKREMLHDAGPGDPVVRTRRARSRRG